MYLKHVSFMTMRKKAQERNLPISGGQAVIGKKQFRSPKANIFIKRRKDVRQILIHININLCEKTKN